MQRAVAGDVQHRLEARAQVPARCGGEDDVAGARRGGDGADLHQPVGIVAVARALPGGGRVEAEEVAAEGEGIAADAAVGVAAVDRKSTRLNSSHVKISY